MRKGSRSEAVQLKSEVFPLSCHCTRAEQQLEREALLLLRVVTGGTAVAICYSLCPQTQWSLTYEAGWKKMYMTQPCPRKLCDSDSHCFYFFLCI